MSLLNGANVYGFLKGEGGLHRRSARRASGERRQQFASVTVEAWEGSANAVLAEILEARAGETGDRGTEARTGEPPDSAQIVRSYHFDSPRHVRDPFTEARHNDLNAVLEGDLDDFILTYLREIEPAPASEENQP